MDLLYENDHNFGELEEPCMGEILDNDVFPSPSPSSSDDYMDNDWLNSFFEDPVLNDKMITDAVPAPRIKSEHSYSINNNNGNPESPVELEKLEDLDSTFFSAQALDLTSKQSLPVNPNSLLNTTNCSTTVTHIKQEPVEYVESLLPSNTVVATQSSTATTRQPTIVLATTPSTMSLDTRTRQIITHNAQAVTTPVFTIKTEPQDLPENNMEQTINIDSLIMPPTPPGSSSSDSEGSQSPQRSAPSSPIHQLSSSRHSPSSYSSCKPYSQPIFTNPIPQSGVLILSEEEKRTLISEGYPIPSKLPLTKQEEKNLKKIRRKIKNKISAQESRRKKKEYLETLEKRVEAFSQENSDLKRKVDSLESNNKSLLGQLQKLQSLVSKVTRPSSGTTQTGTVLMVLVLCFAVFLGGWSPSSLNLGYSRSSLQTPVFFGSPRMVQPAPKMGPPPQDAKVDIYSTPNMRSRVLLSIHDDSTHYEPYAPYIRHSQDHVETEKREETKNHSAASPTVADVTVGEGSEVKKVEVKVVTVDQRLQNPNDTTKLKQDNEQILLHPDIEATAGYINSHADSVVENA